MTVNESQGNKILYQNVELSSLYHHAKFERHWSLNVLTQANVKAFLVVGFFA